VVLRTSHTASLRLRLYQAIFRYTATQKWTSKCKRPAAYELLAPIYGWFIEGFDTADRRATQALLKDLS
jgi:hypothetical protein